MRDECWKFVKEKLGDEHYKGEESLLKHASPSNLYRFLTAREFNVAKAVEMYKSSLVWRLEYKPEEITAESIKPILMTLRCVLTGEDKEGRACIIITSRHHTPGEFSIDDMTRYGLFHIEQAIKLGEAKGQSRFCAIVNRRGMTMANQDRTFMQHFV